MPADNYLVTAIVTTRNRPELVKQAVKSVLGQTHRNLEIVLVDDSDYDAPCKRLSGLSDRIKYIKNEKCFGACYSRNVGIAEAKGDFIAFLDDDDYWLPEKTECQLAATAEYPLVSCNYISVRGAKKTRVRNPELVSYDDMLYHNYLGSCSFVLGTAAAIKKCSFDGTLEAGQDWEMWLSIMKANSISRARNLQSYLAVYNQGVHSRISNTAKYARAALVLYEKHCEEHTPSTADLFELYNLMKADGNPVLWCVREAKKARLKGLGLLSVLRVCVNRILGRIDFL